MSGLSLARGAPPSALPRKSIWPENPPEAFVFILGAADFGLICALLLSVLS